MSELPEALAHALIETAAHVPLRAPADALDLTPHPLRARVLAELHARPFTPVPTPSRLLRFAFMGAGKTADEAVAALTAYITAQGKPPPASDARHFAIDLECGRLQFERHNEFLTYTWRFTSGVEAFMPPAETLGIPMRALPQPGPLIAAIDIAILPQDKTPDLATVFAGPVVAVSDIEDGAARVATDFKADAHGFVRILIEDRSLSPTSTGALAQRLLEIETYRTLALLGLPEAQSLAPALDRIGAELSDLMREVQVRQGIEANRSLLDRLMALAAEAEQRGAESAFRFAATRAYQELIDARFESIRERGAPHFSSLGSFLSRRLMPAIRTCASVETRQADLSRKLARFADLLRTRVDIELESQNATQLKQMSERVRLQLRLQQTVEGLSIAAITYYVSSVLHLLFEGAHAAGLHLDAAVATAVAVPIVAAGVALTVWRVRGHGETE